ncbi:hypothetical protein LNTAR_20228 [Lentisphaera araneosa HTCC2155]|uniref:Uncharacterized protein n=1 Tax=Lentisphaera araneosa HTCC2155 TaxID=313628 RepID=A6DKW8_9BACT|nr:hypothetical protein LNTAR_20228 [Lentisphaera araneosa HTCC2155]
MVIKMLWLYQIKKLAMEIGESFFLGSFN